MTKITDEMLKVRAVQLDITKKFAEVCQKHNLRFWMDGGTLLGAVRHHGYIPWDDDIDLIMPRKDYDKLNKIASQEFTHPYFWQTTYSEPHLFCGHAQIRNVETSAFGLGEINQPYCLGIWIDIFVFDGVPDNVIAYALHRWTIKCVNKLTRWLLKRPDESFCGLKAKKMFALYESLCRMKEMETSDKIGLISWKYRHSQIFHRCHYDETAWLDFENLKLPAPKQYHELLCEQFGEDYMTPKKMPNFHGEKYMSADRSYKEAVEDVRNNPDLLRQQIIKVYGE